MITANQARTNAKTFHLVEYLEFLTKISSQIQIMSAAGATKTSLNVPFSVSNSNETMTKLQRDLTNPPNCYKVSFYSNNTIIVISWE